MSGVEMVSYYNSLTMYRSQQQQASQQQLSPQDHQHAHAQQQAQQHPAAAVVVAAAAGATGVENNQYWYTSYPHSGHHQSGQQYLDPDLSWSPHSHAHFSHLQYQQAYQQHQQHQISMTAIEWSPDKSNPSFGIGELSPPTTLSDSEISSPETPASPSVNNNNINAPNNNNNKNNNSTTNNNNSSSSASTTPVRPVPIRSPYEWIKKSSYQNYNNPGKTRTKDKYRVVYTDHQRLELEKEFHYSRYITIQRKADLAANLALSERQVKIWFQNRRAKDRKQVKKREELHDQNDIKATLTSSEGIVASGMANLSLSGVSGMLGGLVHNGSSPPLNLGPQHTLALTHPTSSGHPHAH